MQYFISDLFFTTIVFPFKMNGFTFKGNNSEMEVIASLHKPPR